MACGDRFAGLLVVKGGFGRVHTPEDPCGLWCNILDWQRWHGATLKIRDLIGAKILDLDAMAGVNQEALSSLKTDFAAWNAAEQREPTMAGPRRELLETKYNNDTRLALGAMVELGKQATCLLERADDLVLASGGVSTTPSGLPDTKAPPKPKGIGNWSLPEIAALVGIAWIGYQVVTRDRSRPGDGA